MRELFSLIVLAAGAAFDGVAEVPVPLPAIDAVGELPDADSDMPDDEDFEIPSLQWCGPQWELAVGGVYWQREDLSDGAILLNDADDTNVLDAGQLDFDHRWGIDLSAIHNSSACSGCELRCLWLDDWTSAARTANPGALNIGTNPTTGPFVSTTFDASYRSRFSTLEASARCALGEATLLAGFRYAMLDEDLLIRGFGGGPDLSSHFATQNDLFGLQLGLVYDWRSSCGACGVGTLAKAGMYYNAIDAAASLEVGGAPLGRASDETEELALLAELGVDATYSLRSYVTLRAGYRLLVVDGVAIAAEQIDRTTALQFASPSISVHDRGTLVAHGFSAGVEIAW